MSRQIDNDHPWTESEIKYKLARGRKDEVDQNALDYPPGAPVREIVPGEHVLELHQDIFEKVNDLDVDQLQSALKKVGLDQSGDIIELKKRLAQHLQSERDGNNTNG